MSKKKVGIIVAVVIIVIAAAVGGTWYYLKNQGKGGSSKDKVYVEAVKSLTGIKAGAQNRFSGVVEPQKTLKIEKNVEKTLKQTFVKEGDLVEEGTPLFEYDTEEVKSQIAQAQLELEGIDNEIADYNNQIVELQAERNNVSEDEKFQYTTQIQTLQTTIKSSEFSKESKKVEITKLETSLNQAVVTSEMAGVIKSISENGSDPYTGEPLPYMTILATGDYRVKGTINELNVWTLSVGQQIIIRSRIDEEKTWTGSITEIDTKNEATSNNNGNVMYDGGSSSETATKYPFYITLESVDGLILGQHVYIELDNGQEQEKEKEKEGLWVYESYVVTEDESSYIWADNGKNKLEKRTVELGEHDAELGMYEIKSGLTEEDFITFPMPALYEGVTTVKNAEEVDYTAPMYEQDGEGGTLDGTEGGVMDGTGGDVIDGVDGGMIDGAEGGMIDGAEGDIIDGAAGDMIDGAAGGTVEGTDNTTGSEKVIDDDATKGEQESAEPEVDE